MEIPQQSVTEEDVIDFLKGNFIEIVLEGWLDEARLKSNTGFVFGWITALCKNNPAFFFTSIVIPESAIDIEPLPKIALREA